jgi:hypothetical protein
MALAATLTTMGACADTVRLRLLDEVRPARPAGCAVDLFPGEKFPVGYGPYADLAYAEVTCRARERCIDELRRQACAVGARGVYWSWEETRDGRTEIDAHLAVPGPPAGTPADFIEQRLRH